MLLEKDLRLRQKAVQCSSFSSASSASTWASSSPVVGFRPRTPELCDEIDCRRGALRALRRSSARSVFYAAGSARRKKKGLRRGTRRIVVHVRPRSPHRWGRSAAHFVVEGLRTVRQG